jgi:tetratricopeptide (TPR) repeat protein
MSDTAKIHASHRSPRYHEYLKAEGVRGSISMKPETEILAGIFFRRSHLSAVLLLMFLCLAAAVSAQINEFAVAMHSFQSRLWADAAARFQNIETAYPGQTEALLYLGKCLVNLNRYKEADEAVEKYSSRHLDSAEALYLLAYVRFRENRPKDSLELSTAAAKTQAPGADDLTIVALDYVLFDDLNNAARYLRESLALRPDNVESHYSLGRVLYQQNHFDAAESEFREVLRMQPRHVKAMDNLGLVAEGKNDTTQAVLAYITAIEVDAQMTSHSEQPYVNLGILLTRLGRPQEAEPWLQKAIKIRPDYAKAHLSLGKTYLAMDRFALSETELATAVRLQPDDSAAHYFLGRAYYRGGDKVQAAKEFSLAENLMKHQQDSAMGMGNSGVPRID